MHVTQFTSALDSAVITQLVAAQSHPQHVVQAATEQSQLNCIQQESTLLRNLKCTTQHLAALLAAVVGGRQHDKALADTLETLAC